MKLSKALASLPPDAPHPFANFGKGGGNEGE